MSNEGKSEYTDKESFLSWCGELQKKNIPTGTTNKINKKINRRESEKVSPKEISKKKQRVKEQLIEEGKEGEIKK